MAAYPTCPAYLIYGNQAEAVLRARDEVLAGLMDKDSRDENLTEHYPTKGETIAMAGLLDEIAGDLATVSFIPGASKCIIVNNPAELFGATGARTGAKKGGKRSGEEVIAAWIEKQLPQTGHHLMLLAIEDESASREVNERSPIYQAIQKIGFTRRFSDTKAFFRIEDALVARDASGLLRSTRDLWKSGKGDMSVYGAVVRSLRYLIQSNIARERGLSANSGANLFPADPKRNLLRASPNVQRKYMNGGVYRTGDLVTAYEGLLNVYRALRPRPGDVYVPDAQGLLEETLLRLLTSPTPRRTSA